jgi:hypothetical protein
VISTPLPWDEAVLFLSECPHVQDLTAYVLSSSEISPLNNGNRSSWGQSELSHMPQVLSNLISSRGFRLHIPQIAFGVSLGSRAQYHLESIPAENLVSIKAVQANWQWNYAGGRSFNNVLAKCKNLEALTLVDTDLRFFRFHRGRLPPVRRLRLENCHRNYRPDHFNRIWDLSQLEDLQIGYEYLHSFLANGRFTQVVGLKKLEIWKGVWKRPLWHPKPPSDISNMLEVVLGNSPNLERLEVGGCNVQSLPMAAIAKLAGLRVLKIRDFVEQWEVQRARGNIECEVFEDGSSTQPQCSSNMQFPSIPLKSLELIQQSCPFITELDLGIDREQNNVNASDYLYCCRYTNVPQYVEYLNAFVKFEHLRFLTLRTHTISDDFGVNIAGTDINLESAKATMSHLQTHQSSGLLSKFTMIVAKRLGAPLNIPPGLECVNGAEKNLIARRSFMFLSKGGDVQVEVVDREIPAISPKVSSDEQHIPLDIAEDAQFTSCKISNAS